MAPAGYLVGAIPVVLIAVALTYWADPLAGIPFFLLAFACIIGSLLGCGYRDSGNFGPGSYCPKCNERHFIWPWCF
ncbi:hypothetical protein Poly51_40030 [Rubripirellula tenax]|uniref:Uncharacterized protein n=1 Tax=Rubripirellula tenax TaxID=2528015 RepID=A0A5C6EQY9_9BACT|nr:hypothetical protein Poly51_40030 [Rubripirellula tenax]